MRPEVGHFSIPARGERRPQARGAILKDPTDPEASVHRSSVGSARSVRHRPVRRLRRRGVRMLRDRADQPDQPDQFSDRLTWDCNEPGSLVNGLGIHWLPEPFIEKNTRDRKPPPEASLPSGQICEHRRNRCSKSALGLAAFRCRNTTPNTPQTICVVLEVGSKS